jgi:hypothetical protein
MLSVLLALLAGAGTLFWQVRLPLIVLFTKLASPFRPFSPLNPVGASDGLTSEHQKPARSLGMSVRPTSLLGIVLLR